VACFEREAGEFLILLLNDGSRDDTAEVLAKIAAQRGDAVKVINKPNSGHGRTCRAGYDMALEMGAPWIFQSDSDGQCDPVHFHDFWAGHDSVDCVFGVRTARDDGPGRVLISLCCRLLLWCVTGAYIRDPNVPYRLIRAEALREALERVPDDFDIQNVALSLVLHRIRRLRWKYVPIHFRARQGGENSINYRKIIRMGLNMLRDLRRVR
jgi:glycosyltransferase involved in cell wall biosynthesis